MRLIDADALDYALGASDEDIYFHHMLEDAPTIDAIPVVRCQDCKYYEIKDYWGNFGGVPILAASDVPTCHKWGDGCMTKPDGYCFMGERRNDK